ncbi:hypothetical protein [Streptomyces sp. NPDC002545]
MLYWYSRASTAETLSGSLRMAACDRDKLPLREWRLTYTGALLPQLRLCGQPFSRSAVQPFSGISVAASSRFAIASFFP